MKQLKCEMCGSADLLKQEGAFICQNCGTKYSVEEAKKMLVEGTVDVQGTVQLDNSNQIENYYNLGQESIKAAALKKAAEYSDKILEIDSNNYKGWKLKVKVDFLAYYVFGFLAKFDREAYDGTDLNGINPTLSVIMQHAKTAFSYADDGEKEDLMDSMFESIKMYINAINPKEHETVEWLHSVEALYFGGSYYKALVLPQEKILHFLKENYSDVQISKYINEYIPIVVELADELMVENYLGSIEIGQGLLKNIVDNIDEKYIASKKTEIDSCITEVENKKKKKETEDKIKEHIKAMKGHKESAIKGDNYWITHFNEDKAKLSKIYNPNLEISEDLKREAEELLNTDINQFKKKGCYVATCVYASYDCPEVWTLRRFRDYSLDETWYGRMFIRTYYAVSPTIVKWFGETEWFKKLWKGKLDKFVRKLNNKGYENTEYNDKY